MTAEDQAINRLLRCYPLLFSTYHRSKTLWAPSTRPYRVGCWWVFQTWRQRLAPTANSQKPVAVPAGYVEAGLLHTEADEMSRAASILTAPARLQPACAAVPAAAATTLPTAVALRRPRSTNSVYRRLPTAAADSSNGTSSQQHQQEQQWGPGASVWDKRHDLCRGWGTIDEEVEPAHDGQRRWRVKWDAEQYKTTCIKECYLDLSLIRHTRRVPPSGLGQKVLVITGTHKGMAGKTVRKVRGQNSCCPRHTGMLMYKKTAATMHPIIARCTSHCCHSPLPAQLRCLPLTWLIRAERHQLDLPAGGGEGAHVLPSRQPACHRAGTQRAGAGCV